MTAVIGKCKQPSNTCFLYFYSSEIHTFKYTHFCTYTQFEICMTKTMHVFFALRSCTFVCCISEIANRKAKTETAPVTMETINKDSFSIYIATAYQKLANRKVLKRYDNGGQRKLCMVLVMLISNCVYVQKCVRSEERRV